MKNKILSWINENCFTKQILFVVNLGEIIFYIHCLWIYYRYIQVRYYSEFFSLINWVAPFPEVAILGFFLLIASSVLVILNKRDYSIWIIKVSMLFSILFTSGQEEGTYYYILWFLIIYYLKSLGRFVPKEKKGWQTGFNIIKLIMTYFLLWIFVDFAMNLLHINDY